MSSEPQERVLTFIVGYIDAHGYPPTVREITDGCGYTSTSTTQSHLRNLMRSGRITAVPGAARTIKVVQA